MDAKQEQGYIASSTSGSESQFSDIYEGNYRYIHNLARRMSVSEADADDLSQEAWTQAYRNLPRLRQQEAVRGWLSRIVISRGIDARRRQVRMPAGYDGPSEVASDPRNSPESIAVRQEEMGLLWLAMASLTARQCAALYLRAAKEYDYRQIAETLDTSVGAIELLLHRARRSLGKSYRRLEGLPLERCRLAKSLQNIAENGGASRVHTLALGSHAGECGACRPEIDRTLAGLRNLVPIEQRQRLAASLPGGWFGSEILVVIAKLKAMLNPSVVAQHLSTQLSAPLVASGLLLGTVFTPLTSGGGIMSSSSVGSMEHEERVVSEFPSFSVDYRRATDWSEEPSIPTSTPARVAENGSTDESISRNDIQNPANLPDEQISRLGSPQISVRDQEHGLSMASVTSLNAPTPGQAGNLHTEQVPALSPPPLDFGGDVRSDIAADSEAAEAVELPAGSGLPDPEDTHVGSAVALIPEIADAPTLPLQQGASDVEVQGSVDSIQSSTTELVDPTLDTQPIAEAPEAQGEEGIEEFPDAADVVEESDDQLEMIDPGSPLSQQ